MNFDGIERVSRARYDNSQRITIVRAIYRLTKGSTTVHFTLGEIRRVSETLGSTSNMVQELSKMVSLGELREYPAPGSSRTPRKFFINGLFLRTYSQHFSEFGAEKAIFVSYVRDDWPTVERVTAILGDAGFRIWLDRNDISVGQNWQTAIRDAIRNGAAVVACFSSRYVARERTYMNEELTLVADELRLRPPNSLWFFPIRLDECAIPERSIGGGRHFSDIQHVDMFPNLEEGVARLVGGLIRQRADCSGGMGS